MMFLLPPLHYYHTQVIPFSEKGTQHLKLTGHLDLAQSYLSEH